MEKHKNFLSILGIIIDENRFCLNAQKNPSDIIYEGDFNELAEFKLELTGKKHGWSIVGLFFSKGGFFRPSPPSSVYRLVVSLRNDEKKYSYLSDFDRIRFSRIIKELNSQLKK